MTALLPRPVCGCHGHVKEMNAAQHYKGQAFSRPVGRKEPVDFVDADYALTSETHNDVSVARPRLACRAFRIEAGRHHAG